jgi:hypothetical protein
LHASATTELSQYGSKCHCLLAASKRLGVTRADYLAAGAQIGDPIVGLVITLVILKITWDSWTTIRRDRGAWDTPRSVTPDERARTE